MPEQKLERIEHENMCEFEECNRLEKTLEFLKQQTGLEFEYHDGIIRCDGITVYNVAYKSAFVKECCYTGREEIRLTMYDIFEKDHLINMEPSKFIDKIAKGEWV